MNPGTKPETPTEDAVKAAYAIADEKSSYADFVKATKAVGSKVGENQYQAAARILAAHAMATQAEADRLRALIKPFADYEAVRMTMGGIQPKGAPLWAVSARAGHAEITVEHLRACIEALAKQEGGEA